MHHASHRRCFSRTSHLAAAFAFLGLLPSGTLYAQDSALPVVSDSKQIQAVAQAPTPIPSAITSSKVPARQRRAADDAFLMGAKQLLRNDPAAAQQSFARAVSLDPGKMEYALSLAVAKEHHVTALIQQAAKARLLGHNEEAARLFADAKALDPDNLVVTQHLDAGALPAGVIPSFSTASEEIAKLSGPIHLVPTAGTRSFHRRGDAQDILREVYAAFGIASTFDSSVTNQNMRFDLDDVDLDTAARVLLRMSHNFATPLEEKSVLLARDTQENRDRLVPMVEETFYLPGLPIEQLTELSNIAKNIFDLKQVSVQAGGSRIVMRGNEEAMKLVNATFAEMIDGGAEVILEVHMYEVDKTRLTNIGAVLPPSAGAFSIIGEAQQLISANQTLIQQGLASGLLVLNGSPIQNLIKQVAFLAAAGAVSSSKYLNLLGTFGGGLTLSGVYLGSGASFNMLLNSSDVRLLDDVQMRVGNNQTGIFRSGTRYPIITSTYTSSVSSSLSSALAGVKIGGTSAAALLAQYAGSSNATIPQVQYEDLGLTLKATPQALKSGQVRLHVELKIEALGAGSINNIPVLNNRLLISDVTIPVGETAMVASEISVTEQRSITGLPGINEIPGFQGTNHDSEKDSGEVLMTITPRLARKRSTIVASRRLIANVSVVEQ